MRRRDFVKAIAGSAATWPLAARAQQSGTMRRVAMLLPYREGDAEGQAVVAAFQVRLKDLGWTEGRNIRFDIRWAGGDPDKARKFARELIGMAPDAAGGRFLARGNAAKAYEKGVVQRVVLIEFDSVEKAVAAHDGPGYQAALKVLGNAAERDMRIVEALA